MLSNACDERKANLQQNSLTSSFCSLFSLIFCISLDKPQTKASVGFGGVKLSQLRPLGKIGRREPTHFTLQHITGRADDDRERQPASQVAQGMA